MFIATLIAKDALERGDISAAADRLAQRDLVPGAVEWIDEGSACDLAFSGDPLEARIVLEAMDCDVVVQPRAGRRRAMLVADMDSTMIDVECIDELAEYAGVRAQVAAVTERAMLGEIDFERALDERVALLRNLDEGVIDLCREEKVRLTPGARTLVRTMRANGAYGLLVSGGFTRFAEPVAAEIGFDEVASNILLIEDGRLTGAVRKPIVDAHGKLEAMIRSAAARGLKLDQVLAVGDGANDIPMLAAAGLGVAFRAKPATAAAADARIDRGDLTALLHVQGYRRADWVED
ncbi:MAG TPA: phosphoserine phosphatase SerB [Allosphingosinicella sp.]|nr:phosphoserine phosphatase SerB [Allosphingosinicella sp.]